MVVVPSDGVGSGARVSLFSDFGVLGPENGTKFMVGNIERWVTDTFGTNHVRTPCHCFGQLIEDLGCHPGRSGRRGKSYKVDTCVFGCRRSRDRPPFHQFPRPRPKNATIRISARFGVDWWWSRRNRCTLLTHPRATRRWSPNGTGHHGRVVPPLRPCG